MSSLRLILLKMVLSLSRLRMERLEPFLKIVLVNHLDKYFYLNYNKYFLPIPALKDRRLKVTNRHKLIGTKVWVEAGEEVTEVEPEEGGYVKVQKGSGEQGSIPADSLSSVDSEPKSGITAKMFKIQSRQKLIGTKVMLEVGEMVTQVEEEEDGYITVLTDGGLRGFIPVSAMEDFPDEPSRKGKMY